MLVFNTSCCHRSKAELHAKLIWPLFAVHSMSSLNPKHTSKLYRGRRRKILFNRMSTQHAKFQDHRTFGFREEDCKVFTIYEHGNYLGQVT